MRHNLGISKMILGYVFFAVFSFTVVTETKPLKSVSEDMEIIARCNETSPVSKRTLNVALVEKRFEGQINHNFKCFLHCLYFSNEWMDFNGNVRRHILKKGLSESTLSEPAIDYLVNACSDFSVEDKCEKAFDFTRCFWKENARLEDFSSAELQWMNNWL